MYLNIYPTEYFRNVHIPVFNVNVLLHMSLVFILTIRFCKKALESNLFLFINNTQYCGCFVRDFFRVKQKQTWNRYTISYPLRFFFIYSFEVTINEMELLVCSKTEKRHTLMLIMCQIASSKITSCLAQVQIYFCFSKQENKDVKKVKN